MLGRLRRFASTGSINTRIARAAVLSGGLSAGVKAASLVKEILVAAVFGVSGQIDAYLIALMLIGIPHGIVVNSVQWTLIPEFIRTEVIHGRAHSRMLLRQAVAITLLILTAVLGIWAILLPMFIDHLTQAAGIEIRESVQRCVLALGIYYFTSGTLLLGYAVLQARKRFLINGAVPLATPVVVAALVLAVPVPVAETLAFGMVAGFAVELLIIEMVLRRDDLTLVPGSPLSGPLRRPFAHSVAKLAGGAAAMSLLPLVEQSAAVEFGIGAVSTLGYANKLPALIGGLAVSALSVAFFPYFSELLAKGDAEQGHRILRRYSIAIGVGGTILTIALILASDSIVRIIFQRGAFDELAAAAVALAQRAYLIQIPGALILAVAARALLSQGRAAAVGVLNLVQLLLFAVGVVVGTHSAEGPAIIALVYSIAVTLTAVGGYLLAMQNLDQRRSLLR